MARGDAPYWMARGKDEVDDVILDLVVHVNGVDDFAGFKNLFGCDDWLHSEVLAGLGHAIHDLALFFLARVTDGELEHEPVDLRFR